MNDINYVFSNGCLFKIHKDVAIFLSTLFTVSREPLPPIKDVKDHINRIIQYSPNVKVFVLNSSIETKFVSAEVLNIALTQNGRHHQTFTILGPNEVFTELDTISSLTGQIGTPSVDSPVNY